MNNIDEVVSSLNKGFIPEWKQDALKIATSKSMTKLLNVTDLVDLIQEIQLICRQHSYDSILSNIYLTAGLSFYIDEEIKKAIRKEETVYWYVWIRCIDRQNDELIEDIKKAIKQYYVKNKIGVIIGQYLENYQWYSSIICPPIYVGLPETFSSHKLRYHSKAVKKKAFFYNNFWFRSQYEKQLYDCLLTNKIESISVNHCVKCNGEYYELDFLIEHDGNKGVIELNGNTHSGRSDYDHEKRRNVMDTFDIDCYEYYGNDDNPSFIVDDFLKRLSKTNKE